MDSFSLDVLSEIISFVPARVVVRCAFCHISALFQLNYFKLLLFTLHFSNRLSLTSTHLGAICGNSIRCIDDEEIRKLLGPVPDLTKLQAIGNSIRALLVREPPPRNLRTLSVRQIPGKVIIDGKTRAIPPQLAPVAAVVAHQLESLTLRMVDKRFLPPIFSRLQPSSLKHLRVEFKSDLQNSKSSPDSLSELTKYLRRGGGKALKTLDVLIPSSFSHSVDFFDAVIESTGKLQVLSLRFGWMIEKPTGEAQLKILAETAQANRETLQVFEINHAEYDKLFGAELCRQGDIAAVDKVCRQVFGISLVSMIVNSHGPFWSLSNIAVFQQRLFRTAPSDAVKLFADFVAFNLPPATHELRSVVLSSLRRGLRRLLDQLTKDPLADHPVRLREWLFASMVDHIHYSIAKGFCSNDAGFEDVIYTLNQLAGMLPQSPTCSALKAALVLLSEASTALASLLPLYPNLEMLLA